MGKIVFLQVGLYPIFYKGWSWIKKEYVNLKTVPLYNNIHISSLFYLVNMFKLQQG